jgi:hypothetical protein
MKENLRAHESGVALRFPPQSKTIPEVRTRPGIRDSLVPQEHLTIVSGIPLIPFLALNEWNEKNTSNQMANNNTADRFKLKMNIKPLILAHENVGNGKQQRSGEISPAH